jgi:hypothetical protein
MSQPELITIHGNRVVDIEAERLREQAERDKCTSVSLSSLRPGALFSTMTGWRGLKTPWGSHGCYCYSYDDGQPAHLEDDTPVWEHVWGGWPAANRREYVNALHV